MRSSQESGSSLLFQVGLDSSTKWQRGTEPSFDDGSNGSPVRSIRLTFVQQGFRRRKKKNQVQYHGMVKWRLKDHQLEMTAKRERHVERDPRMSTTFVFDKQGTAQTEMECRNSLWEFVGSCGGDNVRRQWSSCAAVHEKIWAAARSSWGYPRVLQVRLSTGKSTEFRDLDGGPDSLTDFD